jgi:hypothetical protein
MAFNLLSKPLSHNAMNDNLLSGTCNPLGAPAGTAPYVNPAGTGLRPHTPTSFFVVKKGSACGLGL